VTFSLILQFIPLGLPVPSRTVNQLLATTTSLGHRLSVLPAWVNPDPAAITEALAPVDRLAAGLAPSISHAKETSPTTLEFTRVCEPDPVDQGELITYTLYITNSGTITASILITDSLPANVTFEAYSHPPGSTGGATWYQNENPNADGYVRFFTGDFYIPGSNGLPASNSAARRFMVRVTVPMTDQANIASTAVLTANIPSELQSLCGITVNSPSFEIAKASSGPEVEAGDPLTFTLSVTNTGHLTTTLPFTVTDHIPDGTNYLTSTQPSTYAGATRTITWTVDTALGQDEAVTRTFVVTVTTPFTNGAIITNTTYRAWSDEVLNIAEGDPVTVTVRSHPALTLTKSADPDPVQAGGYLNYTLALTNHSSASGPAHNVVVTDTVPISTWLQSYGAAVSGTDIISSGVAPGGVLTWTLPTGYSLLRGESTQFTFTVQVHSPEVSGTLITNASYGVTSTTAMAPTAGDQVTTTVNSSPALTVTKSVEPSSVVVGQFVTYTIVMTNEGNETATGVTVTDTLPVGFTFGSMVQGPAPNGSPTNVITWTGQAVTGTVINRSIAPGPLTLIFTATTHPSLAEGSVHSNTVTATYSLGDVSTGPTAPVTIMKPTLSITKADYPDSVEAGGYLYYTITVANASSLSGNIAHNVVMTDALPGDISAVLSHTEGATVDENFFITWTVGTLNPGQVGVFTATTQVASPLANGTVLTNTAWVRSDEGVSNSDTETTTIRSAPILHLGKADYPDPAAAGATLLYTITVENDNAANMAATGVVVTDVVPANTTFVTATQTGLSGPAGGVITWTLPSGIVPGDSAVVTFTVNVTSPLASGTVLTNTAWVTSAQGVGATGTETTTVSSVPILTLAKVDDPDPVAVGGVLLYTLIATNLATANATATSVVVTDVVPANTTFVTATQTGFSGPVGEVITWTLSELDPGNSAVVTFTVEVDADLASGSELSNAAWITSAQGVGASDVETTTVLAEDMTVGKSAAPAGCASHRSPR
jgi:uncharacterized repeat protein (TIGR01451 family)